MQAYSPELRRDVLAASGAGASTHEIAVELNVSKSWVRRVKQEWREQGKTAPKATRDRPREWERHAEWITAEVRGPSPARHLPSRAAGGRREGTRLEHLRHDLRPRLPGAGPDAKKKTPIAAERNREKVTAARHEWLAGQPDIDPDRVLLLDETWAETNMTRTRGRSPRGTRLDESVPHGIKKAESPRPRC